VRGFREGSACALGDSPALLVVNDWLLQHRSAGDCRSAAYCSALSLFRNFISNASVMHKAHRLVRVIALLGMAATIVAAAPDPNSDRLISEALKPSPIE